MTNTAAPDQAYEVREKILDLESKLLANTPELPHALRDIHRHLKKDPAIVTLLSDEEIATVITGLKQVTNTDIATKVVKKGGTKAMSKMTVDDL